MYLSNFSPQRTRFYACFVLASCSQNAFDEKSERFSERLSNTRPALLSKTQKLLFTGIDTGNSIIHF